MRIALIIFIAFTSLFSTAQKRDSVYFSLPDLNYEFDTTLVLSSNCDGCSIYYTTDGSSPNKHSTKYRKPIRIIDHTVIRARVKKKGSFGPTFTKTYLRNVQHQLPIVCLSSPPKALFDSINGLYMLGTQAKSKEPNWGANFWSKKELAINFEYYIENKAKLNQAVGLKMFGGFSRALPQKSFSIHARKKYGEKRLSYPFFDNLEIKSFKKIVLRNGGSDWGLSHVRDVLMSELLKNSGLDLQAYQPAIVYINAQFWGLYFIREKIGKDFIQDHHPEVNKDSIDLLEKDVLTIEGHRKGYQTMLDFMETHDLSIPENYSQIGRWMDIDNYICYQVAQIYADNIDAGGNIKYWKSQKEGSKWRWILYDTDFGFGKHNKLAYRLNSLERSTAPNAEGWPNPPWTTFILRKLLENPSFESLLINRFADYMNSYFRAELVDQKISELYLQIDPEMPQQTSRWKRRYKSWKYNMNVVRRFAEKRPAYLRQHIVDYFHLSGTYQLDINPGITTIEINDLIAIQNPWNGVYFNQIPIKISCSLPPEYEFIAWSNGETSSTLFLSTDTNISIHPIYKKKPWAKEHESVLFCNVFSRGDKNQSDWIGITNRNFKQIDISNWHFFDDKHAFQFPENMQLDSMETVYLVSDSVLFKRNYPSLRCLAIPFRLNKSGEKLMLMNSEGLPVDSIRYTSSEAFPFSYLLYESDSLQKWVPTKKADAQLMEITPISNPILNVEQKVLFSKKYLYGLIPLFILIMIWIRSRFVNTSKS